MFAKRRPAAQAGVGSHFKGDSGAAAVEFALLMPVLILLIVGTYAAGWAMHGISSVDYALDRTSRTLQLKPTATAADLQKTIETILNDLGDQKVTLTLVTKTDAYGSTLGEVTARYIFDLSIPFLEKVQLDYQRTATVVLTVPF